MKTDRPRIAIPKTSLDQTFEWLSIAALLFLWIHAFYFYSKLPDTIPVHYNIKGEVDRYGSKGTIWFLPTLGLVIFSGFGLLNRYPHVFNYAKPITEENALREYSLAVRLFRLLRVIILLFFVFINIQIIEGISKLEWWVLPLLFAGLLVPTGVYVYKAMKK